MAVKTHDACNGCPDRVVGVARTKVAAQELCVEDARPYPSFGQIRMPKPDLAWGPHWDDELPEIVVAEHGGEEYRVYPTELVG